MTTLEEYTLFVCILYNQSRYKVELPVNTKF